MSAQTQVIGLFPTPFMKIAKLLDERSIALLIEGIKASKKQTNVKSDQLSHTQIINPKAQKDYLKITQLVLPKLVDFGYLLFGEKLPWSIKEIWTNVLETGGHQSVHAHANSFVSGIIYLTKSHPSANTVFHKSLGGNEFVFSNQHKQSAIGPFNGNKWVVPEIAPGDMVLYPSYLLHEVPTNQGGQRLAIAFNAIPKRLQSWGYEIKFS
jgi:uncharacterized protein (TIGR02466 family)